ncbi:MAG TPA: hypothetical protein VNT03_07820, partial [Baekduia sp.]|nr:hypothetical protein [Baekduia sp.]
MRPSVVAAAAATCFCVAYLCGALIRGDEPAAGRSPAGPERVRAPAAIDGPSLGHAVALPATLK